MRISDWSSDVCSSDLLASRQCGQPDRAERVRHRLAFVARQERLRLVGGQRVDVAPQAGVREPAVQRVVGETRRIDRLAAFGGADRVGDRAVRGGRLRSEEHTSELQSIMRNTYAGFCLKT